MSTFRLTLFAFILCACARFYGEEYDPAQATGTIKGVALFLGDVPTMKTIATNDEAVVAARAGMPPLKEETVVISDDKKIANFVVYVSKGHEKYTFQKLTMPRARIEAKGCQFSPHVLAVQTRQPIELFNSDPLMVNWHLVPRKNLELNVAQEQQGVFGMVPAYDLPENGIKLRNDIHQWMYSYICVIDNPFFGVSKADGTFEFKLPPGDYEISFWHESKLMVVPETLKVTVAAGNPTQIQCAVKSIDYHPNRLTEDNGK